MRLCKIEQSSSYKQVAETHILILYRLTTKVDGLKLFIPREQK